MGPDPRTSALVQLARALHQVYQRRRKDKSILLLVYDDLCAKKGEYERFRAKNYRKFLSEHWAADSSFRPYTKIADLRKYNPLTDHRERLSLILPFEHYAAIVAAYREDATFNVTETALVDPAFLSLDVQRRMAWIEFMEQQCDALIEMLDGVALELGRDRRIRRHVARASQGVAQP